MENDFRDKAIMQGLQPLFADEITQMLQELFLPGTAGEIILRWHAKWPFHSSEIKDARLASNSEIRRWFKNKAVYINGEALDFDTHVETVKSIVLFPKSKSKTTLW